MTTSTFETARPTVAFSVLADSRWIKTNRDINGIPMQTLLYPESQRYAEQIFSTSSEILKFFSGTFCPYPFDQFSFITIDSIYARRAFPGFVGYNPKYLQKEFTTTGYDAHETSLLWWDYTSHGTGPGSFQWTEGFGDYAEIMIDKAFRRPFPAIFESFRNEYLATPDSEDVLYQNLHGNTPQKFVHGKYPWMMHLIRYVIGDHAFRNAMNLVFRKFEYRTFSMDEFISTLEEGSGQSLQWWREEWLGRKGIPRISFKTVIRRRAAGYSTSCATEQLGLLYHLPLEVGIKTAKGMRIEKVQLHEQRATLLFETKEKPTTVLLDPNGWILMKVEPESTLE